MDDETKKKLKIIALVAVILLIILIVLSLIFKPDKSKEKFINAKDYVIEKETAYTDKKGKMPIINLKGEEVKTINSEIMTKYYSVVYNDYDEFTYEYTTYKDILSVFIVVTYANDSEYGKIEYYTYNFNVKENKVLTNKELYEYLNIDYNEVKKIIDSKHKDFYNKDELKEIISYDEYLETINYKEENDKVVIKDKTLYKYNTINPTQSLTTYPGNINEIKLIELK